MKITVEQVGNPKFPRYILALDNGCHFDGTGWTPNRNQAMCYAKLTMARADWRRLSKELQTGLTMLTASIRVTVKAATILTPEQVTTLAWYLSDVSSFQLDYGKERPDWLTSAVVSSQIVWGSLRMQET